MGAPFIRTCLAVAALLSCSAVHAHPGHDTGALAGLLHPLLGLDHLLAMVAVGVWAALLGPRATWLVPASFITIMAASAGADMAGIALPLVEPGIAASVLLIGLLIAFHVKLAPAAAAAVVGVFAVFHGHAHGAEMPLAAAPWIYGAGFVFATGLLHGLGLLVGTALNERKLNLSITGALMAASGGWMLATLR